MQLPPIDEPGLEGQHGRIAALLEKLKYNPANLEAVLEELDRLLREHFAEEEALMRVVRFRGIKAHAAEHRAMAQLLGTDFADGLRRAPDYPALLELVGRFEQVYSDHVQDRDQELAVHLLRRAERERLRKARPRGKGRSPARGGKDQLRPVLP